MNRNLEKLFILEEEYSDSRHLLAAYNNLLRYWHSDKAQIKKKYIEKLSLFEDDIFPVFAYTSGGTNGNYIPKLINNSIRNGNIRSLQMHLIELLDLALRKLPSYNNQIVFRMVDSGYIDNLEDQINLFRDKIGEVFIIKHFLSTSKVSWSHKMTWRIETHSTKSKAKDIEMMSAFGLNGEMEVLFARESKFQILGVEKKKDHYQINLKEVLTIVEHSLSYINRLG